jgi:hypothetical protein
VTVSDRKCVRPEQRSNRFPTPSASFKAGRGIRRGWHTAVHKNMFTDADSGFRSTLYMHFRHISASFDLGSAKRCLWEAKAGFAFLIWEDDCVRSGLLEKI